MQQQGTEISEDGSYTMDNTVLKMAKKRALVDGTLKCRFRCFHQDLRIWTYPAKR